LHPGPGAARDGRRRRKAALLMNLTNELGLPEAIVRAVMGYEAAYFKGRDRFRKSDISVTQLIEPPRKIELQRRHREVIVEDVSERIYALLGQSVHGILEQAGRLDKHVMVEERIYTEIDGWTVSGQMDRCLVIETPVGYQIDDWKLCSVWEALEPKPEKAQQLNLLAALLRRNRKKPIVKLRNIMLFRDWSKTRAAIEPEYPQRQVKILEQSVWGEADAEAFLRARVSAHQKARAITDDAALPVCTPEERWQESAKFAVMKGENKRATKLCASKEEAESLIEQMIADTPKLKGQLAIVVRPSEPKRCISYCGAAPKCSWYQEYMVRERKEPPL